MTAHHYWEDDDAYGGPWIVQEIARNPGNLLTANDIAKAVTSPGRDLKKTFDLIRYYAKSGYLHPVARETEGRKSYLYQPDQVLSAEILLRMGDFGVSDANAANAAWRAITIWRREDFDGPKPPAFSPGMHVILEHQAGVRDWTFELWLFRHATRDQKRYSARLAANQRGEGTGFDTYKADGFEARSVFAVDLIDFLDARSHHLAPRQVN